MSPSNILNFIEIIKDKYQIIGAMVAGSYVTGKMKANSDIDLFFISNNDDFSIRGRTYYNDTEFEYFISPEWKYYDRIQNDLQSIRIYSSGLILFDKKKIFESIKIKSIEKIESLSFVLNDRKKSDYSYYIETILKDGIDLIDSKQNIDFIIFSGSHLQKMSIIICEINNRMPVYVKYYTEEMQEIDNNYMNLVSNFIIATDENKKDTWIKLCKYIISLLGNIDIREYELSTEIHKSLTTYS